MENTILVFAIFGALSFSSLMLLAGYSAWSRALVWWRYREIAKVDRAYPGWRSVVKSEAFHQWLETQPVGVALKQKSYRASDAIELIRLYEDA